MKPSTKNILITGIAGFIGFHLAKELINEDLNIIGLDNLNSYYDVELKKNRIESYIKYMLIIL